MSILAPLFYNILDTIYFKILLSYYKTTIQKCIEQYNNYIVYYYKQIINFFVM